MLMIKDFFSSEFSKSMNRLPFVEDSKIVSITFNPEMLLVKYRKTDMKEIEILLQKKDKKISRIFHDLRSMKIFDKNVFTIPRSIDGVVCV